MSNFDNENPKKSKLNICCKIISKIRHLHPIIWLLIIIAALVFFAVFVPKTFWHHIWVTLKSHYILLSMILIFCLVAVSLVWTAGQSIDSVVFSFFNKYGKRPLWLDRTMLIITEIGNGIVTVVLTVILFFAVNEHLAYDFILGTLTLWLVVEFIKSLIRRPRPYSYLKDVRVVGMRARGKSFPSGHTSQAFYMATLLVQYFRGNIIISVVLYIVAVLVGTTRMYMGMHYPRDVLAGAVLGTFWGFIGVVINSVIFRLIGA